MNKKFYFFTIFLILSFFLSLIYFKIKGQKEFQKSTKTQEAMIFLPQPQFQGKLSLEEALLRRRSRRTFKKEKLTLKEISQILWAAQGITDSTLGKRTVPSAGALYPLEIYLVTKEVEELPAGVFKYQPENHCLKKIFEGDISKELAEAALGQDFISEASVVLIISAVFERTTKKYGKRGLRYVFMEAGHAAQNVYLQVESLDLATVAVGAFDDEKVKQLLSISEEPLYIMPIGKK